MTGSEWLAFEAQVREEAMAGMDRPLVVGQPVAWAITTSDGPQTDGLSAVHIVGNATGFFPKTKCGIEIPAPVCRLVLSPHLIHAMDECWECVR